LVVITQFISTNNIIILTDLGVAAIFIVYGGVKVLRSVPRPAKAVVLIEEARPVPVSLYIVTKTLIARGDRIEASSLQTLAVSGAAPAVDRTLVDGDQMVAVQIQFTAVSTTTLKEVGFNFQSLGHGLQIATRAPSTVSSAAGGSFYGTLGSTGLSLTN
jgi:hypothetical protein